MPSLDAITELEQMTSNYSTRYGLSSAATITHSSRQYHASAWEFLRQRRI